MRKSPDSLAALRLRKASLRPRAPSVVALLVVAVVGCAAVGCDTNAKFQILRVHFDPDKPVRVVGAVPGVLGSDGQTFTPVCAPQADGANAFRVDLVLKSTPQQAEALADNRDLQIRPGDFINDKAVTVGGAQATLRPADFSFATASGTEKKVGPITPAGKGPTLQDATVNVAALGFELHTASRTRPVAVAVIVDHSGSMFGWVDPDRFYETPSPVTVTPIQEAQSDPNRQRYLALQEKLAGELNVGDRLIAWFIREDGVHLACALPDTVLQSQGLATLSQQEQFCFDSQARRYIADPNASDDAFDILAAAGGANKILGVDAQEMGRTPLWTAVAHAWDFLQKNTPGGCRKSPASSTELNACHIVVLTDSPDTCSADGSYWVPAAGCDTGDPSIQPASFQAFLDIVVNTDDAQRIPVSFIQLQSKGYPEPDPAQVQVACLTGGTYQFINGNTLNKSGDQFRTALSDAVTNVRDTLGGVWHLLVTANTFFPSYQPAARWLQVAATLQADLSTFGQPQSSVALLDTPGKWDRRLKLPVYCGGEADCEGSDADCIQSCTADGNVCAPPGSEPFDTSAECCCGQPVPQTAATFQCDVFKEPCCSTAGVHTQCKAQF